MYKEDLTLNNIQWTMVDMPTNQPLALESVKYPFIVNTPSFNLTWSDNTLDSHLWVK